MVTPHRSHAASVLADGRVLVAGGITLPGPSSTKVCETFDPGTGTWTRVGDLSVARGQLSTTRLPNGRVLAAGGSLFAINTAETFDPGTGLWTATANLLTVRTDHTATLLPNGKVLAAGGLNGSAHSSTEYYDPGTGLWTPGPTMAFARYRHAATMLPDGRVLVAGGFNGGSLSHGRAARQRRARMDRGTESGRRPPRSVPHAAEGRPGARRRRRGARHRGGLRPRGWKLDSDGQHHDRRPLPPHRHAARRRPGPRDGVGDLGCRRDHGRDLRPGVEPLVPHGQHGRRAPLAHGHPAAVRRGAGGRRRNRRRHGASQRRALQPEDEDVALDREPRDRSLEAHGDAAGGRPGARDGGMERRTARERRALRPVDRDAGPPRRGR